MHKYIYQHCFSDNRTPPSNDFLHPDETPSEVFSLEVKQINAYFQVPNFDHHVNLLQMRAYLDLELKDWSQQVKNI